MTFRGTGKPVKNIYVFLSADRDHFRDDIPSHSFPDLKTYQKAYKNAEVLHGRHHLTDKGYLLRGFVEGLPSERAELNIDENISGLEVLNRSLRGELVNKRGYFIMGDRLDSDQKKDYDGYWMPRPTGLSVLHRAVANAVPTVHLHGTVGEVIRIGVEDSRLVLKDVYDGFNELRLLQKDIDKIHKEIIEMTCPEALNSSP